MTSPAPLTGSIDPQFSFYFSIWSLPDLLLVVSLCYPQTFLFHFSQLELEESVSVESFMLGRSSVNDFQTEVIIKEVLAEDEEQIQFKALKAEYARMQRLIQEKTAEAASLKGSKFPLSLPFPPLPPSLSLCGPNLVLNSPPSLLHRQFRVLGERGASKDDRCH